MTLFMDHLLFLETFYSLHFLSDITKGGDRELILKSYSIKGET